MKKELYAHIIIEAFLHRTPRRGTLSSTSRRMYLEISISGIRRGKSRVESWDISLMIFFSQCPRHFILPLYRSYRHSLRSSDFLALFYSLSFSLFLSLSFSFAVATAAAVARFLPLTIFSFFLFQSPSDLPSAFTRHRFYRRRAWTLLRRTKTRLDTNKIISIINSGVG